MLFTVKIFKIIIFSVQSSVSKGLIDAAFRTNANILKTDSGLKMWKYFNTKEFTEICKSQNFIEQTAIKYIESTKIGKAKNKLTIKTSVSPQGGHPLLGCGTYHRVAKTRIFGSPNLFLSPFVGLHFPDNEKRAGLNLCQILLKIN